VQAGGQLFEEPFAAFLGGERFGLGIQDGVVDLDAVALVQLDQQGAHVGHVAGLLVQHQRLQFVGGGGKLVGVGVVHPHGGWAMRVGSGLVDDAGAPTHRWPPCCGALGASCASSDYP
jgi:hypothetical protein